MEQLSQRTSLMSYGYRTSSEVTSWKRTACSWLSVNSIPLRRVMRGPWWKSLWMVEVMKSTRHPRWLKALIRTKIYARAKCSRSCKMRCIWRAICVSRIKRKSLELILAASRPRPSPMSFKKPTCWVKNSCWTHKSPKSTCVPPRCLLPSPRQRRRSRPLRGRNSPPNSSITTKWAIRLWARIGKTGKETPDS